MLASIKGIRTCMHVEWGVGGERSMRKLTPKFEAANLSLAETAAVVAVVCA